LNYAFSIAQENESNITLLHVAPADNVSESAGTLLETFIPDEAWDWCKIQTRVEVGHPYRAIERVLAREKPDLLVMNIHGKGMLHRAILGSTAERVVRSAKCPVLLIPPMKKAARKSRKRAA
jgi:nucleotide-binding universal stress UspA family protein